MGGIVLAAPPALCKAVNGGRRCAHLEEFGTDLFATGDCCGCGYSRSRRLAVEIEPVGGKIARVVVTEVRPDAYGVNQACPVSVSAGPAELRGVGRLSAQLHEHWWGHWVEEKTDDGDRSPGAL